MTYVQQGAFTNGGPPALAQGVFNAFDQWILSVDQPSSNNIAGTTSGSVQLYQFLTGTVKAFWIFFSNYKNSTATEQYITLPTAFTQYAGWIAFGGIPQIHIATGTTNINSKISDWAGFPTGSSAGAVNPSLNQMNGFAAGELNNSFDHIGLGVSQGQSYTAGALIIGI